MKYNFSCDKLFHFYPEARVPPNSELSGLLEKGDLRAPVTQDIYSVDTTIKRKLYSPERNPLPCSIYTHALIQELHRCTA